MSVKVMDLIWQGSEHKGSDLLVLLAIGDNADEETGIAYPGIEYLARKTRLSPRGVQYAVKRLLDSDELELLQRGGRKGGERRANTYRVQTQSLRQKLSNTQTEAPQHATGCTPTVSKEPSEKQPKASPSLPVAEVWAEYERLFPDEAARGKGLTPSKERTINAALKEYDWPDLAVALRGFKKHREGPGKGRSTDIASCLSTNIKSGPLHEHIGFWIKQAEQSKPAAPSSERQADVLDDEWRKANGLDD